jgi:predicted ATPase
MADVTELRVEGYRSIRALRVPLRRVNVIVGPNGVGKTNLYRAMVLLAEAARGRLSAALAEEGGMPSVLWAGDRKKGPVRLRLGVMLPPLAYALSAGLTPPARLPPGSPFALDPEVKEERVWPCEASPRAALVERRDLSAWLRDDEGRRVEFPLRLAEDESVLSQLAEPQRYPELATLRQAFLAWRFYHSFRTDADAPARQPQIGFRTPVLSADGRDLAAALATIRDRGDAAALDEELAAAFPGASLAIREQQQRFSLELRLPGLQRPLDGRELSDGTLRYLCLLAALLSPRPPPLLALNEPETSIHPDLIAPLARLLNRAARSSQLWITTHSDALAAALQEASGAPPVRLEKVSGETRVAGQRLADDEEEDEPNA